MIETTWEQKYEALSGRGFSHFEEDGWIRVGGRHGEKVTCSVCGHLNNGNKGCIEHISGEKTLCAVVPSEHPRNTAPPTWLHKHKEAKIYDENLYKKKETQAPTYRASDESCDKLYRWLLSQCPLNVKYKAELAFSGLKDLSAYGVLNQQKNNKMLIPFDIEEGIAGTFKDKGKWYINCSITGLLLPVMNHLGQIYRMEIKIDDRCKEFMGAKSKYVALTSDGKTLGCSPNTKRYGVVSGKSNHRVYFTEGRKKAQVVTEKTGHTCVYMTGVGNWKYFLDDVTDAFPETKEVAFVIDADAETNISVGNHKNSMISYAAKIDCISVFDITWNGQLQKDGSYLFKGVDDALLNGIKLRESIISDGTPLISVEEAVRQIKDNALKLIHDMNPGINLFDVTVGAGKTTGLVEIFNELASTNNWPRIAEREARVLWLVDDNYKLLDETETQFTFPIGRMEGRKYDPKSPFHCENYEEVQKAGAAHHNVMRSVCTVCPYKDFCSYLSKKDQVLKHERFVIGVKSSFLNNSNRIEEFDVIVVDESMTDHAFVKKVISMDDLNVHQEIINYVKTHEIYSKNKYKESIDAAQETITTIKDLIELSDGSEEEVEVDYKFRELTSIYIDKKEIRQYINEKYGYAKVFMDELYKSKVHIHEGKMLIDVPNYKLLETMREKLVINLDATPRRHKLHVFGHYNHYKYNVRQYMNVYQVLSHRGSKKQLSTPETAARFLQAIEGIATKNPLHQTVVLTSKFFANEVKNYAEEAVFDVEVGWFGNHTRGFNKFAKANNVVLAGNYCRNLGYMRMEQRMLEMLGVKVELEELVDEDSINEMIQAIGRGRATRRIDNPVNVFLLTNRPMTGIYNIKYVPNLEFFYDGLVRDQQKANKLRREETISKVKPVVLDFTTTKHITQVPVSRVAEIAGVSRAAATEAMKAIYLEELKSIVKDKSKWFYLTDLSQQMKPMTTEMALAFGLDLTTAKASVLDKYTADDLTSVISRHDDLYAYLEANVPVSVNVKKWNEYITFLKLKNSNGGATKPEIYRQLETHYLEYASNLTKAYFEDHFETKYEGNSALEVSNEAGQIVASETLKHFALSLYHGLLNTCGEDVLSRSLIACVGLTEEAATQYLSKIYYGIEVDLCLMKEMYSIWVTKYSIDLRYEDY